jgi:phospholipid N-methyltransferase
MDKTDILAGQFLSEIQRANINRQGHIVAELACLSFLVERRIATLEEIEQRIRQVREMISGDYLSDEVGARTDFLIQILRDVYGPKPHGWTPRVIEGGLNRDQGPDPTPRE